MHKLIDRYYLYRLQVQNDPEAFVKIYDRYVTAIYRFVFFKLPRKEDAQDVTAEVFTKFWQYIQQKNSIQNIRALLYQIARTSIADFYRRAKDELSLDEGVTFLEDGASTDISDEYRGKLAMEARGELALIMQELDSLKEEYKDVLVLRLVDGLSFGDIAQVLNKTTGNIRVIYHRAMKALRDRQI